MSGRRAKALKKSAIAWYGNNYGRVWKFLKRQWTALPAPQKARAGLR